MTAPRRPAPIPADFVATTARISGGFWKAKQELVRRSALPYQWRALNDEIPGAEPSHAVENFRIAAGESRGEFHGTVFQDSDVAKWLEAASYVLRLEPDPGLEARVDELIRLIGKAQRPDGYVNSYFTIAAPEGRWQNLAWGHELYCAGHLIEAAVAHAEATGKTSLLEIAQRFADCIDRSFGPEEGKIHGCCGHPEIELALFRLWRRTGEPRYRSLAIYFIEERGRDPRLFMDADLLGLELPAAQWRGPDYFQSRVPVREQEHADGHAVRAMYLYAAMADECAETGDPALLAALRRLWDSAVGARMYITGGIGSQAQGERFTADYDLPSDTAYAETCASIGMVLWAARMSALDPDARYADTFERALYNGALSGMSQDGTKYFYVNPLEVEPSFIRARQDHEHVAGARVRWLGCSCCPPNIARLVSSFGSYLYGRRAGGVAVHHYAASEAELDLDGVGLKLVQEGNYPWEGEIVLDIRPERPLRFVLSLRIPGWCDRFACRIDGRVLEQSRLIGGYLEIDRIWQGGERVELELEMGVKIMAADSRVAELAGKRALQRGPLVYCFESCDNGPGLHKLVLDGGSEGETRFEPELLGGSVALVARGFRERAPTAEARGDASPALPYAPQNREAARLEEVRLVAVPYHLWGNREAGGEMRVWIRSS